MNQLFSIFDLIVIAGMIQGVVYAVLLLLSPVKSQPKSLTIVLLLVMVLLSFKILLHTLGLWQQALFRYFPLAIDTLFQPLIYLYALSLTKDFHQKKGSQLIHFIVPALFMVHGLLVYFLTVGHNDPAQKEILAEGWGYNRVKWTEDILAILSAVFYWVLSFRHVQQYRKWLFENQSDTHYPELTWIRNLLIGSGIFVITLTVASLQSNIIQTGSSGFVYTQLFYVYLSFLIYFFAINGRNQVLSSQWTTNREESTPIKETAATLLETTGQNIPFDDIREAIITCFEEKQLHLDPDLSLKQLAAAAGYPIAQVSATINRHFDQNFRNLVNSYRVTEVKKRLSDSTYQHLTLLGIALDCGFNSEASFYRIFRKFDGTSPKTYQRSSKQ